MSKRFIGFQSVRYDHCLLQSNIYLRNERIRNKAFIAQFGRCCLSVCIEELIVLTILWYYFWLKFELEIVINISLLCRDSSYLPFLRIMAGPHYLVVLVKGKLLLRTLGLT